MIDPVLAFSTFLGGHDYEDGRAIAVDGSGNAYVTGTTLSANFPTTPGAFQTTPGVGFDAFVTKLNPTGSAVVYSTYLGGSTSDFGGGIAVDAAENAYVVGTTTGDFPTTAGAFQPLHVGINDAFVAKLDATGSALLYSTYLGGGLEEDARGVALDPAGNAYVTGNTHSTDFPSTPGSLQTSYGGGPEDGFITKLNPTGSALVYSTYLGASGDDIALAITVDVFDSAYVTGRTDSSSFLTTPGAPQTSFAGVTDAFVTKLNSTGSLALFSTYLGGNGEDYGRDIAVDAFGGAYVTGPVGGTFPTTPGAFQTTPGGGSDGFVAKLDTAGSSLTYATFLGGSASDVCRGIDVDAVGNAYVTGDTSSPNFPILHPIQAALAGGTDAFVVKLDATGSGLLYSTYLGGAATDSGLGIALDTLPNPSVYLTGLTESTTFPTTPGAFQTAFGGGSQDAFVAKITDVVPTTPTTLILTPAAATNPVDTQHCVTATVDDASGNAVPDVTVRFTVTGSVNTSGSATTDANGQAAFCYEGPSLPGMDVITAFADTDNDNTQDAGEPMGAATKTWMLPVTTPLCEITITNGGRMTALNGDSATFGGNAKSDAAGNTQGQEAYQDHGPAQPLNVHSINVLAIVCDGLSQEASIYGQATIDGAGSFFYRIKVKDLGEAGVGQDTYWILLQSGYNSGEQVLEGGNVQIKMQE